MKFMKNIHIPVLLCLALLSGCKEEKIPTYSGGNYLHFTYMQNRDPQTVDFNFALQAPLTRQASVPVGLTLWGNLLEEDMQYRISFPNDTSRTNATPGDDFKVIAGSVFSHKNVVDTLYITVYRDEELLKTDFFLTVKLESATNCTIGPREYAYARINVTDEVEMPSWWKQSTAAKLGDYSDIKYRLCIIFLEGKILPNLDEFTGIEFQQKIADFKAWWIEQWNAGLYHYYAEDGTTPLYETILD